MGCVLSSCSPCLLLRPRHPRLLLLLVISSSSSSSPLPNLFLISSSSLSPHPRFLLLLFVSSSFSSPRRHPALLIPLRVDKDEDAATANEIEVISIGGGGPFFVVDLVEASRPLAMTPVFLSLALPLMLPPLPFIADLPFLDLLLVGLGSSSA